MQIMCNGIFKSPMHRVVVNAEGRISVALFYQLELEKDLEPAPGLVDQMRPRLYKKVTAKDFAEAHFRFYLLGKNYLDWLKV